MITTRWKRDEREILVRGQYSSIISDPFSASTPSQSTLRSMSIVMKLICLTGLSRGVTFCENRKWSGSLAPQGYCEIKCKNYLTWWFFYVWQPLSIFINKNLNFSESRCKQFTIIMQSKLTSRRRNHIYDPLDGRWLGHDNSCSIHFDERIFRAPTTHFRWFDVGRSTRHKAGAKCSEEKWGDTNHCQQSQQQ